MSRSETYLPELRGRLLEVHGSHVWTHLEPARDARPWVRASELTIEENDESVVLKMTGRGFWFARSDLQLHLPHGSRVRFRIDAGGLHAENVDDIDLDFNTQAGTMHVENTSGRIRLHTKSGTIHVERFAGAFDVDTMAGTIHLEIDDLIAGTHRARTYAGSLHCELSGHIEADIEARATLGAVRNQARSYRDAVVRLQLISDVGGVRVEQHPSPKSIDPKERVYRPQHLSAAEILERVAKGALGVEQAEALLDRLDRRESESSPRVLRTAAKRPPKE